MIVPCIIKYRIILEVTLLFVAIAISYALFGSTFTKVTQLPGTEGSLYEFY
jgi:hypothetical protein